MAPSHRLIETHPMPAGGQLWLAYDFARGSGEQDIFQRPLGPAGPGGAGNAFRHDLVRVMFNLPNGFLAYAAYDADGRRVDVVPQALERPEGTGHVQSRSGASCIGCHSAGPFAVRDELRSRLQAAGAKELLEALRPVLREEDELKSLFQAESLRFRNALIRGGVDPDLWIAGLEPVTALMHRYDRDVSLSRVAADFGLPAGEFGARLSSHTGPAHELAMRLRQGLLRRAEVAALFAGLTGEETAGAAAPARDLPAAQRADLVVLSDRTVYKVGDLASFSARASADCRLTLISVNRMGKAIVLFPNEFEQDNLLIAGRELRVPGPKAPYQLRLKERGQETLIGVCTQTAKVADGIQPDYERQRFTILGDWRNFVRAALEEEAAERLNPEKDKDKDKRKKKSRARPSDTAQPPRSGKPEVQTRTAIRYTVE
jgi:hypothetical protein